MNQDLMQIPSLILLQLEQRLTPDELAQLKKWAEADPANKQLLSEFTSREKLEDQLHALRGVDVSSALERFKSATKPAAHHVHFLKTTWFRYAAILLLIAGTAIYLLRHPGRRTPEDTLADITRPGSLGSPNNDLPPGTTKATLTLADGSTITLDSAANGNLAQQGNNNIVKLNNGTLAYQGAGADNRSNAPLPSRGGAGGGVTGYNTIATPKGGQYQITLPDGTKVWLNAASSIRFPTAFGKDRRVHITGEAYLEVASITTKPFYVQAGDDEILVLGTSFNVNAYPDEKAVKTSLVQGSIKINNTIIKPGQAYTNNKVVTSNVNQDIAWKNGMFNFEGLGVEALMRQIARWYDVEVRYATQPPSIEFVGRVNRATSLTNLLNQLTNMGVPTKLDATQRIITVL